MRIERKEHNGKPVWLVRWWEAWRPRSCEFDDEEDAKEFRKELRKRRRVVRLHIVKLVIAIFGVAVGVVLLWDMRHREPVAGAFTRVGGATRVETAIEASRFWFAPGPQYVVKASQDPNVMWRSAWCAVDKDAPLFFAPTQANRKQRVDNTLQSWPSHPTPLEVPDAEDADCQATDHVRAPARLSILDVASASILRGRVPPSDTLAPLVVFAAAKTPSDAPDVAVGLALAAHLAQDRDVSLVVVPRYLQADKELEEALRDHDEVIEDGIVLGQTGILSEDVRTLLRQVITSSNRKGILGEVRTTLGSLEPVVAALLALLGLGAASRAATELAQERVGRTPPDADSLKDTRPGRNIMAAASAIGIRRPRPNGIKEEQSRVRPQVDLAEGRAITIRLRSNAWVRGTYAGYADLDTVPMLQVRDGTIEPADRSDEEPVLSASIEDDPGTLILVPIADIALIERFRRLRRQGMQTRPRNRTAPKRRPEQGVCRPLDPKESSKGSCWRPRSQRISTGGGRGGRSGSSANGSRSMPLRDGWSCTPLCGLRYASRGALLDLFHTSVSAGTVGQRSLSGRDTARGSSTNAAS
jgi:hypothetical protein